jgi:hypothetical protein
MNHNEPKPKTMKNKDGVIIPFGSADIKAILSYFYAYPYQVADTFQLGRRCERSVRLNSECKQDLNAGAFHMVLANRVGRENKGFVVDMDRFKQVSNHPIMSYATRILKESGPKRNSAPGTVRTVKVSTTIIYGDESINSWEPLIGTRYQKTKKQNLKYLVEVDSYGSIIGGEWVSAIRPDFLWTKDKPQKFTGHYQRLPELLND